MPKLKGAGAAAAGTAVWAVLLGMPKLRPPPTLEVEEVVGLKVKGVVAAMVVVVVLVVDDAGKVNPPPPPILPPAGKGKIGK